MLHEASKKFRAKMESLLQMSPFPFVEGTKYLCFKKKPMLISPATGSGSSRGLNVGSKAGVGGGCRLVVT